MTIDSWRAAIGGSWSRLLLYPGGLTALGLALALALLWRLIAGAQQSHERPGIAAWWCIPALAAPLLAIGSLPLPAPTELRVALDLPTMLLLLELPALVAALDALRSPVLARQADGAVSLAGLLTAAPVLALVLATVAMSSGTLVLAVPPPPGTANLIAAICWALALAPLLQFGPWYVPLPPRLSLQVALQLRRAGHLSLAVLPWLARWPSELPVPPTMIEIREKLPFVGSFMLLALLLIVWDSIGRRGEMRRLGLLYIPVALVLIGVLLLQSVGALQDRLQ